MQQQEFKKLVGKFSTGVTVITGNYAANNFGFTASSFASLSLEPLLVSFNIANDAGCFALIKNSTYLNINILAKEQKDLAYRFAKRDADKFAETNFTINQFNIPKLVNSLAILEGKIQQIIPAGDHHIVVLEIFKGSENKNLEPLIYYSGVIA